MPSSSLQSNPPRRAYLGDIHLSLTPAEMDRLVVRIDRSSVWGNPFRAGTQWDPVLKRSCYVTKQTTVNLYENLLRQRLRGTPGPILGRTSEEGKRWSYNISQGGQSVAEREAEASLWIGRLEALAEKYLACWCRPGELCHGDAIITLYHELPRFTEAIRQRQLNRAAKERARARKEH